MNNVSQTECAICYEMIRYGQEVDTISVLDDNGDEEPAFAHSQCAEEEAFIYASNAAAEVEAQEIARINAEMNA